MIEAGVVERDGRPRGDSDGQSLGGRAEDPGLGVGE